MFLKPEFSLVIFKREFTYKQNVLDAPKKCNKMIFQRLPKKMRRRVMSTTVKRMPKDLQSAHKKSVRVKVKMPFCTLMSSFVKIIFR